MIIEGSEIYEIERIRYDEARNMTFIRVKTRHFLFGTVVFNGKIDEEKFRRLFGEKPFEALFGQGHEERECSQR